MVLVDSMCDFGGFGFFFFFYLFLADLGWFGFGWSNYAWKSSAWMCSLGGADFFSRLLLFDPEWCASDYFVPEFVCFLCRF